MSFITQDKTNWKFIAVVSVLAIIVGGGILLWSITEEVPPPEFPPEEVGIPENLEISLLVRGSFLPEGFSINIYSDGSIFYKHYHLLSGEIYSERRGELSDKELKELIKAFHDKDFFAWNGKYFSNPSSPPDLAVTIIAICFNEKTYTVKEYGGSGPEALHEIIKALWDLKERTFSQQIVNECQEKTSFIEEVRSDPTCLAGEKFRCINGLSRTWYFDKRMVVSPELYSSYNLPLFELPKELKDAMVADHIISACSCEKPASYRILIDDNLEETTCEEFYQFIEDYDSVCDGCIETGSFSHG